MAYIHTPACYTESAERGVDAARRRKNGRWVRPPGEMAPGVGDLGWVEAAAAITAAVATIGSVGAGIYFQQKDSKDQKATAANQEALAKTEAKRADTLQQEQLRIQKVTEYAKAGLDEQGKPAPGGALARVASSVPGGWITLGVGSLAVVGLVVYLVMRRRKATP